MSTPKRELLPYILIVYGPKRDKKLRLMATDITSSGMICKWAVSSMDSPWIEHATRIFRDFADPRTLKTLEDSRELILGYLRDGMGTLWISPSSLEVVSPFP